MAPHKHRGTRAGDGSLRPCFMGLPMVSARVRVKPTARFPHETACATTPTMLSATASASPSIQLLDMIFIRVADFFSGSSTTSTPVRLKSEYVRTLADRVLAANDLEDFNTLIDEMFIDENFWISFPGSAPVEKESQRAKDFGQQIEEMEFDDTSLVRVLGIGPTTQCRRAFMHGKQIARDALVVAESLRGFGIEALSRQSIPAKESRPEGVVDLLYSPKVPISVLRLFRRALRILMAMVVIGRAEEHGKLLEPWLAQALAETFSRDLLGFSWPVFLDWVGGIASSDEAKRFRGSRAAYAQWIDEAKQAGKGVYAPIAELNDA